MMKDNNEMLQAAYALNLCTVSVSQIIDYDDINILEQEYESILNNLNLQNMPDDDALLDILKQLLDTITYFRMSEGDKRILERRYEQRMKNAIWSAVPNFGMIVAGGSPLTMAVSLASQVGIGYMNYRKEKAAKNLDMEDDLWKLQRSAIDQFNGLRRELFDTAWRLSKNYKFEDRFRLTERQISQYNTILMDCDLIRKYQRLEAIQGSFEAYPPFWYYFGNAANLIARDPSLSSSPEIADYYSEMAYRHFKNYWDCNKYNLLREDHLASQCALEFVDMLIDRKESPETICEYIDKAVAYSGNSCDILQLCAVAYLKINNQESAFNIFKYLVNESYNTSVNAQILSGILINRFKSTGNIMYKAEYDILASRASQRVYLLPWNAIDSADYIASQRALIIKKYKYVLDEYKKKYSEKLNRILPVPDESKTYPDKYFRPSHTEKRIAEMKSVLAVREKRTNYLLRLCTTRFSIRFIDIYNELLSNFNNWYFIDLTASFETVKNLILENQQRINFIQSRIQTQSFDIKNYIEVQKMTSPEFAETFYDEITDQLIGYVNAIDDMKGISEMESHIYNFCEDMNIKQPEAAAESKAAAQVERSETVLSYELLGSTAKAELSEMSRANRMIDLAGKVTLDFTGHEKFRFIKSTGESFGEYFANKKLGEFLEYKDEAVAILDDKSFTNNFDLVFTTTGIACIVKDKLAIFTTYEHVRYDEETDSLIIEDMFNSDKFLHYDGKKIGKENLEEIFKFITELDNICSETEE